MTLDKNCIVTFTGRVINPMAPNPDDISIVDIAHSLSNQCRFTGHTSEFYSVAQHSVLVEKMVGDSYKLWGLLHDATEAYLSDLARPIKRASTGLAEAYETAETRLMEAVAERFDLPKHNGIFHTLPPAVKKADMDILKWEVANFMPERLVEDFEFEEWQSIVKIDPWTPKNAKTNFLIRFAELTDNDFQID